eukprot:GHVU01072863.1.p2 GENE.GHVU01072863.1~~GHVU01072863.1.p2  ORF type:complete len:152 (+),score=15.53 GHVU01072863.1:110-565(+)
MKWGYMAGWVSIFTAMGLFCNVAIKLHHRASMETGVSTVPPSTPPVASDDAKLTAYFINMERSVDRRDRITSSIGQYVHLESFPAVIPEQVPDLCYETQDVYETNSGVKFAGELALTLSHMGAIRKAYRANLRELLLLEDDASPLLFPYHE